MPVLSACGPALTPLPYTETFSDSNSGWKTASDEAIKISVQAGTLQFAINDLDTIAFVGDPACQPSGAEGTGWWFNSGTGQFRASDSLESSRY